MATGNKGCLEDITAQLSIDDGDMVVSMCEELQNLGLFMKDGEAIEKHSNYEDVSDDESQVKALISDVLFTTKRPVSVSHLNFLMSMSSKCKVRVDYTFLRKFQQLFTMFVIGDDLKVFFRNQSKVITPTSSSVSSFYTSTFLKDDTMISRILRKLKESSRTEVEYETMLKEFGSNKYRLGLSFILRNSDIFELHAENTKTYVRISTKFAERLDLISEANTWKVIEVHGFETFLAHRLASVLEKFSYPLLQGTLQCCFSYGHLRLDKNFIYAYSDLFEIVSGPAVSLVKKQYMESGKSGSVDQDISSCERVIANSNVQRVGEGENCVKSKLVTLTKFMNMRPQICYESSNLSTKEKADALLDIKQVVLDELSKLQ